jgi:hypothetical protein
MERCRGRVHALASTALRTLVREGWRALLAATGTPPRLDDLDFGVVLRASGAKARAARRTFARQLIGKRE